MAASQPIPDQGVPGQQVPAKEKVAYAMTSFGLTSIAGVISAFALYYFTDVALISPASVAWLLFVVRFFDGAVDPLIGHYMDGHMTKHGKYRGYLISGSLPFCLLSVLVFLPCPLPAGAGTLLWYLLLYLAWSFCHSILESANLPLLVVMTKDPRQRYQTNSAKILGGILATLVARYLALELVALFGGGAEAKGYALTAATLAAVSFVFLQFPARRIRERNLPSQPPARLWQAAASLLRDKKILFLLLFYLAHQMASSVKGQAAIYYLKYIVERQDLTALFLVLSTLSSLLMQPLIILCARRLPLPLLVTVGYLGGAAGILLMGSAGSSIPQLFAGNILYGVTIAFPANLLFVYTAELADRHQGSSSAMLHSLLGLAGKLAVAVSGALIALILSLSDYIPNMLQSADAQAGIKFAFLTVSFVLFVGAALLAMISFRYPNNQEGGSQ